MYFSINFKEFLICNSCTQNNSEKLLFSNETLFYRVIKSKFSKSQFDKLFFAIYYFSKSLGQHNFLEI